MSIRALVSLLTLLITMTMALTGLCEAQADKRILIGVLHSARPTGLSQLDGIQAAVKRREMGGLIELVLLQYRGKTEGVDMLLAEQRGQPHLDLVLGPTDSDVAVLAQEPKVERPLVVISPVVVTQVGNNPQSSFFRTNVDLTRRVKAIYDFLTSRWIRRVGVIYADTEFGRLAEQALRNMPSARGATYVAVSLDRDERVPQHAIDTLTKERPEALGIFADQGQIEKVVTELRPLIGADGPYRPLLFMITGGIAHTKVVHEALFASAVLSESSEEGEPANEVFALSSDTMDLVVDLLSGQKLPSDSPVEFRKQLDAALNGSLGFEGRLTGMRFASYANVAPLHIYHLQNGKVENAERFASTAWGRVLLKASLVLRTHGYTPLGILLCFVFWSAWSGYDDVKSRTTGHHSLWGFAAVIAALAGFNLLVRVSTYVILAEMGQISWSEVFAAVGIALAPNVLFAISFFTISSTTLGDVPVGPAALYDALVRWACMRVIIRRYHDTVPLVAAVAFHNSRASLQQAWERLLDESRSALLRSQLHDEVAQKVEEAPSPFEARRVYARALIQRLPWEELTKRGLVPEIARDPSGIADVEMKIEEAVHQLSTRQISPEDLDFHIRQQLRHQTPDLGVRYESLLAESDELSERSALRVRTAFLVLELGQELTSTQINTLIEDIERSKQSAATAETGPTPKGVIPPSLYLRRLVLRNIRCFRDLALDFVGEDGVRPWTMLLGDNGLGKTTILRSIAMALCDETNAAALMQQLPGKMLRNDTEEGTIRVELGLRSSVHQFAWTETELRQDRDGLIRLKQTYSNGFPRDRLFVCGYGALRRGFGSEAYSRYQIADSVRSLFDYHTSLQNPELAFRRADAAGQDMTTISRRLETVLTLSPGSIRIDSSGIAISGPWGSFVPVGAIGDGYQATLAWVADMFGWSFAFQPSSLGVSGVVLIDEIEKHLHPRWQREIVRQLGDQFPDVHFVATTHSPICAGGLADLEPGTGLMYYFKSIAPGAVVGKRTEPFAGWRYDQFITSEVFGLESARDASTEAIIERIRRVYDERGAAAADSPEVHQAMRELKERSVEAAEDERDRQLRASLAKDLEDIRRMMPEERRS